MLLPRDTPLVLTRGYAHEVVCPSEDTDLPPHAPYPPSVIVSPARLRRTPLMVELWSILEGLSVVEPPTLAPHQITLRPRPETPEAQWLCSEERPPVRGGYSSDKKRKAKRQQTKSRRANRR